MSPNLSLTSIVIWTVWLLEEGPAGKANCGEQDSSEKIYRGVYSCLSPEFIYPFLRIILLYAYIPDRSTLGQYQPCGTRWSRAMARWFLDSLLCSSPLLSNQNTLQKTLSEAPSLHFKKCSCKEQIPQNSRGTLDHKIKKKPKENKANMQIVSYYYLCNVTVFI